MKNLLLLLILANILYFMWGMFAADDPQPGVAVVEQHRRARFLGERDEVDLLAHLVEGGDVDGDGPHHHHEAPALPEDVHPEPAHAGKAPGTVQIEKLVDPLPVPFPGNEFHGQFLHLILAQPLFRYGNQLPVDPGPNHVPGFDVDIGIDLPALPQFARGLRGAALF